SHTASKPYMYEDVSAYYNFQAAVDTLAKDTNTFAGRKLWNERLVRVEGKDYWFTIDPIFDFEVGKDTDADFSSTYNNIRWITIQGGLGKKFSFYTSFFESQGRRSEEHTSELQSRENLV